MRYCDNCGAQMTDDMKYCSKCGKMLAPSGAASSSYPSAGDKYSSQGNSYPGNGPDRDPNRRRLLVALGVTCVLLGIFIALAISLSRSGGKEDAQEDIAAGETAADEPETDEDVATVAAGDENDGAEKGEGIPEDAVEIEGNYYKVYNLKSVRTWQQAEGYCEALGGHLAVITSDSLNDALYELARSSGYKSAFFGFSDSISEGNWKWVTSAQPGYRNWGASEPNAANSSEDYAMFSTSEKNGKWNDSQFGFETRSFICQWGDKGITDGSVEIDIPKDAVVFNGHSYCLFDNGMKSWSEAQQYCQSRGGDLAVINDAEENKFLYKYMRDLGYDYAFFGYTDKENEGDWRWVSSDTSYFEDWGKNAEGDQEPNGDSAYEDYAEFSVDMKNGHWNDSRFGNDTSAYICEWDTTDAAATDGAASGTVVTDGASSDSEAAGGAAGKESAAASGTEKSDRQIYKDFYDSVILPEGRVSEKRIETVLSINNMDGNDWYSRSGVIGADFADLDSDGTEEMVVYYCYPGHSYNYPDMLVDHIYAEVYSLRGNNEVVLLDTVDLDEVSCSMAEVGKAGIMKLDGKNYIYQHIYKYGIMADGWRGYYTLFTLDNGAVRKAYMLGNPYEGSSDMIFCVQKYSDENSYTSTCYAAEAYFRGADYDFLRSEGIEFADDMIDYDHTNDYECEQACWKSIGVKISPPAGTISKEPDYWDSDLVRGGYALIIHDTSHSDDYTSADVYSSLNNRTEYSGK